MKTFLALYMGANPPLVNPPQPGPDTVARGMAAWTAWMTDHAADVVGPGGPLGSTKKISPGGLADVRNNIAGFTIVQAESHEAAAKMFENHPHFAIFPGDSVEIMEQMPIPGA